MLLIRRVFQFRLRGLVVVVDPSDVPLGALRIGRSVHQGDQAWRIVGVEMINPTPQDGTLGLILSPWEPEPDVARPLELGA